MKRKRRLAKNALTRLAYHEAGHVVAGIHYNLGLGTATIESRVDDDAWGEATVADPLESWERGDGPRRPLLEQYLVVLCAGASAERAYGHPEARLDGSDQGKAAFATANDPTLKPPGCIVVGDEAFEAYLGKMQRRADLLIRENFVMVEVVAKLLLRRKTVEPDEVYAALGMSHSCLH